ncbi:hypothetical protein ACQR7C_12045 [Salmonella enterica]|uniref:hypothetical protein n=1 Tax=Salmonella enterica TaxID=28901 RepID=UPI003D2F3952
MGYSETLARKQRAQSRVIHHAAPVTLPDSLCAFIRSLDKPPVVTPPTRSTTEPETDNASDTTAPPAYPPPPGMGGGA